MDSLFFFFLFLWRKNSAKAGMFLILTLYKRLKPSKKKNNKKSMSIIFVFPPGGVVYTWRKSVVELLFG